MTQDKKSVLPKNQLYIVVVIDYHKNKYTVICDL